LFAGAAFAEPPHGYHEGWHQPPPQHHYYYQTRPRYVAPPVIVAPPIVVDPYPYSYPYYTYPYYPYYRSGVVVGGTNFGIRIGW